MTPKPKHKLYDAAYTLFVEQGMTCAAIAETLDIYESRLSEWRKTQKWDELRNQALSAPDKIKMLLIEEMQWVAAGNKPRIDADALSKIGKSLTYFDGKVSLPVIATVIKEFDNFMAEVNPKKAVEFTEFHKLFLNHRAKLDNLK